jgi:hypothetical protein
MEMVANVSRDKMEPANHGIGKFSYLWQIACDSHISVKSDHFLDFLGFLFTFNILVFVRV